jgi:hypothetical protein
MVGSKIVYFFSIIILAITWISYFKMKIASSLLISILQDLYDGLKKNQFGKGLILVPKIQYTYKTLIPKMGINLGM